MLRNMFRSTVAFARQGIAEITEMMELRPPKELVLFNFANKGEVDRWETSSDAIYGGRSTSTFKAIDGKGIFQGHISLDFDPDKTAFIKKSGFAGVRSKKDHGAFDLHPFDSIEFYMKGDGRTYVTSLRTRNFVDRMSSEFEENMWQAFIDTKANEWKVYRVPFNDYQKSWRGRLIVWDDLKLNPRRILGMGFHVLARTQFGKFQPPGPGPYKLEIDWIKGVRTGVGYDAKMT